MFRRINKLYFLFPLLVIPTLALSMLAPLSKANALAGSDFNPGHIIDDAIFTNSNSMSVSDIQNFLNSKVPTCDTNGSQSKSYYYDLTTGEINVSSAGTWVTTSRALYGQRYADFWNYHTSDSVGDTRSSSYLINESVAPYVCLKNYVENPSSLQNNLQNPGASISGGESAAQIIYNAAQQYQINPQVLLTTLQKEQGIVTDDWPWMNEYRIAMGYACPDGSPCDAQYYGFANQVNSAAAQFRRYFTNPNHYNFVVGNDYIPYNPDANCGGSTVNVQNQATADLYDYTPFQPNAGALASVSSTSPGGTSNCGAYGNRNFWWYFNTWFGPSLLPSYSWYISNQSLYTNPSMTSPANLSNVHSGDTLYVHIQAINTGTATWINSGNNPVRLGTWSPQDRSSPFCDNSWISCSRPTALQQSSVAPGQAGTFNFEMKVPNNQPAGNYSEGFEPVAEGATWFTGGTDVNFTVTPTYSTYSISTTSYTDSSESTALDLSKLPAGQSAYVVVNAVNNGNATWTNSGNNPVRLGTWGPQDQPSPFCNNSWINCSRAATLQQSSVAPGQTGTFAFTITAPQTLGNYDLQFNLVAEGLSWGANTVIANVDPDVQAPIYSWSIASQQAYQDSGMATSFPNSAAFTMTPGQTAYVRLNLINTGNVTWINSGNNPVRLGTWYPQDVSSPFCANTWISCARPTVMQQSSVAPGQTGTFTFTLIAPQSKGSYQQRFNLVSEGNRWFIDTPQAYNINVSN